MSGVSPHVRSTQKERIDNHRGRPSQGRLVNLSASAVPQCSGWGPTFVSETTSSRAPTYGANKIVAVQFIDNVGDVLVRTATAAGDESLGSSFWGVAASPSWWRLARGAGGDVVVAAGREGGGGRGVAA